MAYQPNNGQRLVAGPAWVDYSTVRTFPALEQKSSWFEQNILDPMRSFGSGSNSLLSGAGWLAEQMGAEDFGGAIQEFAQHGVDYWQSSLTPETQDALKKDLFDVTDQGVDFNFTKLVNGVAGSAPSFVVGLGAGGVLAKGLQLFANPLGRTALVEAINAGKAAGPGSAAWATAESAAKSLQFVDNIIGIGGYGASEGAMAGAAVGAEVSNTIKAMDHKTLSEKSERYRTLYDSYAGETEERRQQLAKGALADEASTDAGWKSGLATAVLGAPAGAFFGRILGPSSTRLWAEAEKFAVMRGSRTGAAIEGLLTEGGSEALQSASEQMFTNLGIQQADETQDTFEGVGEAAIEGGLIGGVLGGGVGAVAGNERTQQAKLDREKETDQRNTDRLIATSLEAIKGHGLDDYAAKILEAQPERGRLQTLSDLAYMAENGAVRDDTLEELFQPAAEPDATEGDGPEDAPNFGMPDQPRTLPDDSPLLQSRAEDVTPEREAMRSALIAERFADATPAPAGRKPIALLMGGGMASGKSTVRQAIRDQGGYPDGAVEIDADSFKAGGGKMSGIPEFAEIMSSGDSRAGSATQAESMLLYKRALETAIAGKYDVVLDRSMATASKGRAEIRALKDAGYEVRMVGVTAAPEVALRRAHARGAESGRYVPNDVLLDSHKGFSRSHSEYVDDLDSMSIYDNGSDGKPPAEIARKIDGKLQIIDEKRYNAFVAQGEMNERATTYRELAAAPARTAERNDAGAVGQGARRAQQPPAAATVQGAQAGQQQEVSGLRFSLRDSANEAATSDLNDRAQPTEAQTSAGNYAKGHRRVKGLDISFENPAGSTRVLAKREGKIQLKDHYGYVRGFNGADGDQLDVYVRDTDDDSIERAPIFAVEQLTPDGKFDEHKVYMGYESDKDVRASFVAHQQLKPAMRMSPKIRKFDNVSEFKQWAREQEQTHQARAAGFEFVTGKDGRLQIRGDLALARQRMKDVGVPTKGSIKRDERGEYLDVTPAAASATRAAITLRESKGSRAGAVVAHSKKADATLLGSPPKYNTERKMKPLRELLKKLALEGEPGRFWYEQSSQDIMDFVGGDKADADLFAKLLAIYSPQAKVDANTTFAIKAFYQLKAGLPVKVKTGSQDRKAQAAADGAPLREWMGEKTNNFYVNLMLRIDPKKVANLQGATIDMWMMRAFEYESDAPTATQYHFAEVETNRLARELGWEPQQVQAAIWVAMKARTENKGVKDATESQSEAAGDMAWVETVDEDTGKKKSVRDFPDDAASARHRRRWLDNALAHVPTKEDTAGAGFHFGNGLRAHASQLSWEATPSKNVAEWSWIHDNMAAKMELQARVRDAIGSSILRTMNLMTEGATFGFGGWEGVVSPSNQEVVVAGSVATQVEGLKSTKRAVMPAIAKRMDAAAAMYGMLLKQDGVAWHRPFFAETVKSSNGVHLEFGRALTADETAKIYNALVAVAEKSGVATSDAQMIAPIPHETGVRFLNFGTYENNADFHKAVMQAATDAGIADSELHKFRSDGNLVQDQDNGGYKDGEGYRQRIIDAGFGDQLGRVESALVQKIDAVYADVAAKYGPRQDVRFRLREGSAGSAPDARGAQAEQGRVAPKFTSQKIQKDAVSAVGIHYGKAGLKALDPTMAGTGAAGGERRRLGMGRFGLTNPRVNFYIREPGQAVPPSEAVVGGAESYQVELMNLYDYDADPRGFFAKYPNNVDMVEEEVTDAGFDGILFPKHPQIPVRTAIVFGFKRKIPVVPVPAGEPLMDLRYSLKPKAEAIQVDGKQRSTTDSTGKPIHPTEEGLRNFWRWFGDSKVVDGQGRPLVLYHGTAADVESFDPDRVGQIFKDDDRGFFFTTLRHEYGGASSYANRAARDGGSANVIPVYIRIINPFELTDDKEMGPIAYLEDTRYGYGESKREVIDAAVDAGNDGVIVDSETSSEKLLIALDPKQIKSAIGNGGAFSSADPRIAYSLKDRPKQSGLTAKAVQGLVNTLNWAGKDKIRVFDTVADLPLYLQQSIESGAIMAQLRDAGLKTVEEAAAKGIKLDPHAYDKRAQGFYDPASRSAVVIAGNIDSPEQAYRTIVEEHLRHEGFRRFFTPAKMDQFLDGIYSALPQEGLRAVAKTYSANLDKPEGRRLAAEEYIAKMKLDQERSPLMARVGDWVRGQLRSMGFEMTYSNRDVIHILQQIEDGVRSGRIASPAWNGQGDDPVAPMYSLSGDTDRWYYSAMLRSVETGTGAPKKAGATQWKQWLDGAQRRGEFKQAEREWIGVDEWLDGRGDTTRAELVEFVNSNQVMVDETVLGDVPSIPWQPAREYDLPDGVSSGSKYTTQGGETFTKFQFAGGWYAEVSSRGGRSRKVVDNAESEEALDAELMTYVAGELETPSSVKFDGYQLPGGQNYRELLLTMPVKDGAVPVPVKHPVQDGYALQYPNGDYVVSVDGGARHERSQDPSRATQWETERYAGIGVSSVSRTTAAAFASSHFDQPNILAHVRFNERTDSDGKRVLFVEEIQSDWHQAGRKQGYSGAKTETVYVVEYWQDGRLSSVAQFPTRERAEKQAEENRKNPARSSSIKDHRWEVVPKEVPSESSGKVPDAPLKKEWPLTAMKRMIRWAAENGFDRLAWTTGDQQAERYDLSKSVASIRWENTVGDIVKLTVTDYGNHNVIDNEMPSAKVDDYIGKELGDKIRGAIADGRYSGGFSGDGLRVGGEGMRGFYDKMLPTEVGKYVKKFGGQVSQTGLRNGGGVSGVEVMNSLGIPMNQQAEFWANADRDELIEQYRNNGQRQPSIDITPAMRQAAIAGQPLFRLRDVTSTPEIEGARRFISGPRPAAMSLGDRVRVLMRDIYRTWTKQNALEIEQGLFDSGASIKDWEKRLTGALQDASESAGKMYDLARNPAAVLASVMRTGVPKLIDGAFQPVAGRKGLIDVFRPLYERAPAGTTLVHLWEDYAAARRSSRLITEQNRDGSLREKQLSEEQIKELLKLGGQYLDESGNSIFEQVFDDWQAFNSQMLDFAVENGVLSAQMRKMWAANDYVPFYRVIEELTDQAAGNSSSSRLTGRQVRSKRLTGGVGVIEPIFESIVKNSAYVLDSVYKNETMKRTVKMLAGHALTRAPMSFQPVRFNAGQIERALQNAGIVMMSERDLAAAKPAGQMALAPTTYRGQLKQLNQQELDNWNTMFTMVAPAGSNVVSVMIDGKAQYYFVDDPLLLRSIQAIGPQSMSHLMKFMSGGKELLTNLVTTDPGFMAVNFLRDTISAWVTSSAPFKPVLDGFKGALDSFKDDPLRWKLQTAGASLGGYYDTRGADAYAAMELDTGSAPKLGIRANWRRWQRFGAHFENANRMAIARSIIDSGGTVAEAAYQALDIMNFSMHGDSKSIRALTMTVPFMNARLQGLYRLWRGRNAASFWQRGAIVAGATLALMFKNWDDDRYWELEEFERDAYWHFWLGDEHIKVAKPFEVGQLFGTIWERTAATAFGPDTARLLIQRMGSMAFDTFAMNPVPQIVKPIIEQYANKNSFTGRPIENQSLQGLLPEQRYMPWTSESARVFAAALPDWAPAWLRSPVRVEALVRGYMGTLGLYALQASDQIARPLGGFGEPPAMALKDMPVVRRFYGGDTATRTKYEEPIYKLLDIANETRKSVMELRRRGDAEGANEIAQSNADILAARGRLNAFSTQMRALNMQERAVWNSSFTAGEKKVKIDALRARRNDMLRQSAELLEKLDPYLPYL